MDTYTDREEAVMQEIREMNKHFADESHLSDYSRFLQMSISLLRQEYKLMQETYKDSMDEISESVMLLRSKHYHTEDLLKRFVIESSRILETHKLDVEKEREKNYSLKEKIRITNAKLAELEASINIDLSKHEAGRVEPHRIKLMQAKQSVALMRAKIQAEEADFEEITERAQQRKLAAEQSYYAADSERNQEISNLHSELDDINDELRYYEQRAADRKAAIKAAKEQAENQNFELDRRRNLPTLYDKNGRRLRTKKKKLVAGNYVYI